MRLKMTLQSFGWIFDVTFWQILLIVPISALRNCELEYMIRDSFGDPISILSNGAYIEIMCKSAIMSELESVTLMMNSNKMNIEELREVKVPKTSKENFIRFNPMPVNEFLTRQLFCRCSLRDSHEMIVSLSAPTIKYVLCPSQQCFGGSVGPKSQNNNNGLSDSSEDCSSTNGGQICYMERANEPMCTAEITNRLCILDVVAPMMAEWPAGGDQSTSYDAVCGQDRNGQKGGWVSARSLCQFSRLYTPIYEVHLGGEEEQKENNNCDETLGHNLEPRLIIDNESEGFGLGQTYRVKLDMELTWTFCRFRGEIHCQIRRRSDTLIMESGAFERRTGVDYGQNLDVVDEDCTEIIFYQTVHDLVSDGSQTSKIMCNATLTDSSTDSSKRRQPVHVRQYFFIQVIDFCHDSGLVNNDGGAAAKCYPSKHSRTGLPNCTLPTTTPDPYTGGEEQLIIPSSIASWVVLLIIVGVLFLIGIVAFTIFMCAKQRTKKDRLNISGTEKC